MKSVIAVQDVGRETARRTVAGVRQNGVTTAHGCTPGSHILHTHRVTAHHALHTISLGTIPWQFIKTLYCKYVNERERKLNTELNDEHPDDIRFSNSYDSRVDERAREESSSFLRFYYSFEVLRVDRRGEDTRAGWPSELADESDITFTS